MDASREPCFSETVAKQAQNFINGSVTLSTVDAFLTGSQAGYYVYLNGLFLINSVLATTVGTFVVRNQLGGAPILQFSQPHAAAPVGYQIFLPFQNPYKSTLGNALSMFQGLATQGTWIVLPDYFYSSI